MTTSTKYAYIALALTMYPVYTTANPMLSINVYESPPTRWITNGVLVVGVTDGECSIATSIKHETKWGAGNTFNLYTAVNILKYMHTHGFNNVPDPFTEYGMATNAILIEASLEYYYGNCKILVKNETDITEEEYITSYAIVSKSAEKYFYNSVEAIDLNNNNNNDDDDTTMLIIISITCSSLLFCFVGCCIFHNKHK